MTIQIPPGVDFSQEHFFPKLSNVMAEAKRLDGPYLNFESRAKGIYQIIELLASDGRLDRKVLSGDICCLDVGTAAPEAPVFLALGSNSVTLAEGFQPEPTYLKGEPRVKCLPHGALDALRAVPDEAFDYITMFNTFNRLYESECGRIDLIRSLARVLRPGGHFTVTADGTRVGYREMQILHGEIGSGKVSDSLHLTFPKNKREPMWGRGWVMRSILVENVMGFSYDDYVVKPHDDYLDASILTVVKR